MISLFKMRLGAAFVTILLVAVMDVAAVQGVRSHRKVLQGTTLATANKTIPTALTQTESMGAEAVNTTVGAANNTNATGNGTDARARFAGSGSSSAELPRCRLISCKKRKLLLAPADMAATAANETKAAVAEAVNATEGAVNATKSANATGNATDARSRRGRGDGCGALGRGPEICYGSISCRRRKLQQTAVEPAATAANETKAAPAEAVSGTMGEANSTNATGNATDARARFAGSGSSSAELPRCRLIACKKRKLLQAAADMAATAANATKAAVAEAVNATEGAVNATQSANATGNATEDRSRRGRGGDGWGGGRSGYAEVCADTISCRKRKLMQAATDMAAMAANETMAAAAANGTQTANTTGNATGNASDDRSKRGGLEGVISNPIVCDDLGCSGRQLMQATAVSTTDPASTHGMEPATNSTVAPVNATGVEALNATLGAWNVTGNATGNATEDRSRRGRGGGDGWAGDGSPYQPRTAFGV